MEKKPFDYNSFIGMILLGGIMLWYLNTNKPEIDPEKTDTKEIVTDSSNISKTNIVSIDQSTPIANDSLKNIELSNKLGAFAYSAVNGKEGSSTIENNLVRLTVDNKGGQISIAEIKNYKLDVFWVYKQAYYKHNKHSTDRDESEETGAYSRRDTPHPSRSNMPVSFPQKCP